MNRTKLASTMTLSAVAALLLVGCGNTSEPSPQESAKTYSGRISNVDENSAIVGSKTTPDNLTVQCDATGGTIKATITDSKSGNSVTATQPSGGEGYGAAKLTVDDINYEFVPRDGIREGDVEKLVTESYENVPPIFENQNQYGSPVNWSSNGTADFYLGLHQVSPDGVETSVEIPGKLDCSQDASN